MGLLFGTLTFLLIVSSVLSYILVRRIYSDVQNLGQVVAPLKEAVLEMQISIGESNRSIIQYSIDRDDQHIRSFLETKIEFEIALKEFNRLVETEPEKEAGRRVDQIHSGFGEISDDIIGVTTIPCRPIWQDSARTRRTSTRYLTTNWRCWSTGTLPTA